MRVCVCVCVCVCVFGHMNPREAWFPSRDLTTLLSLSSGEAPHKSTVFISIAVSLSFSVVSYLSEPLRKPEGDKGEGRKQGYCSGDMGERDGAGWAGAPGPSVPAGGFCPGSVPLQLPVWLRQGYALGVERRCLLFLR